MDRYAKQFERAIRAETDLSEISKEHELALIEFCEAVQDLLGYGNADYVLGGVLQWGPSLSKIYSTPIGTDAWNALAIQAEDAFYKD